MLIYFSECVHVCVCGVSWQESVLSFHNWFIHPQLGKLGSKCPYLLIHLSDLNFFSFSFSFPKTGFLYVTLVVLEFTL